jgi:Flp pilus assembly protein TadD
LELQPDNATALYYEGYIAMLDGRFEEALDHLQDAIRCSPSEPKDYHALALTYNHLKRAKESEEAFGKFHELQAVNAKANGSLYLSPDATPVQKSPIAP